ncbi:MAG: metalloprotease PmbA [Succinivibrio sp.]
MTTFEQEVKNNETRLEEIASSVVKDAIKCGADECDVDISGVKGLSVSSRNCDVENIEFNRDNGMTITVYKDKKSGSASTTDLSEDALHECVKSSLSIASYSNPDDCGGIADKDLICTEFRDLKQVFDNNIDADEAVNFAVELEKEAAKHIGSGIKNTDGSSFDNTMYSSAYANSNGFCKATSASFISASVTLLGESNGKMHRGSGYSVALDKHDLLNTQIIAKEALDKTLGKLNPKKVPTGKYNVIFYRRAAASLFQIFSSAIAGGAQYRHSTFLHGCLGTQIFPEFVTIHEDPFVYKGLGSKLCDSEGVRVQASDIVKDGILKEYLLGSYSSRKLNLRSNGHAGGIHNWYVGFGKDHTCSFEELLLKAGEGIVVTDLMGQGVDLTSGNYSRGAEGFYFKDGKFVHAVDGITVAGNLKDMFMNMSAIADDADSRLKLQAGSVLIPGMAVSGL